MKKTKAQSSTVKTEEKNINGKNVMNGAETAPSDIRVKDGGERELDFKKVLYGYDPDEVKAYIDEMNKTHGAAVRNYESRLSSVKEELLLSNRERDSLNAKYRKIQTKAADGVAVYAAQDTQDENRELREALFALQEKLEQTQAEKDLLEKRNRELKAANEDAEATAKKYDSLSREFKELASCNEILTVEISEKEKGYQALLIELEDKKEKINALSDEAEASKRTAADFEIKNGVLARRLEEKEAENAALKEQNKAQAYDYAEKLNGIEIEQAQSRLAAQRDMQLREYFINRAELTLAELTKQMEQIKQSFGDSQQI